MASKRKNATGADRQAKSQQQQGAQGSQQAALGSQIDAEALLRADHRKVEKLFQEYESAGSDEQKFDLARKICTELIVHSKLEEEIFYPACREKSVESDLLDEAQVEHDTAKILIGELMSEAPDSEFFDAKVSVLSEYIKHHVGEEEKPSDGIFAKAKAAAVDMNALGQRLQSRKQELLSRVEAQSFDPPQPRALSLRPFAYFQENQAMERRYDRDRDEYGRFTSDDDDRGYSRGRSSRANERERDEYGRFTSDDNGGGRSSGRYGRDEDERGYSRGRSSGSNYRERDEYGRFTSDDDDDRGGRSMGGRDDDRGGRSMGGREGSGWYGDSRGHSEASRRGWENRGNWRSSGRDYDDDDDRSYRSGGGRGQGGWFGDPEGHSEASRRGWEERGGGSRSRGRSDYDDDDDRSSRGGRGRSQGGWFGDSEGHAEAARRGWEERGGGSRSRSRSDEDDDRSSRGRGQGGWFGDSRGHAEAARRGWQNR